MFPLTDPILVFTILMFTILIAPLIAERLRVPDLILLLIAGAILGPNALHILERGDAVKMFGSVGLLYIMFLAGLDIDIHRFESSKTRSLAFGLLTFAIPQGLGTLVGRYLLDFNWTTSVLMASMFASHTLLAYPIAGRLGISKSEPVSVTVGATILTDVLALLVLAVIADSKRGVILGFEFWTGLLLGMAIIVALAWKGIPFLSRWFFDTFTETGGAQFLFVLTTVCAFSYLSHFAKMEPIIGAFLAGAAFNRLIPEHSILMNRVVFVGNTFFIPVFLISVGMLVDPRALIRDPKSWLVAAVMTIGVIATKYIASEIAGRSFGYDRDSRRVMFGLSVVQAAATLAAALVGYELGIFDSSVLNGAIAMIIVTCPLGAWMVDRYGRTMAVRAASKETMSVAEQRLLVPVSHPDYAPRLLDLSFLFRDAKTPGMIHPVTIVRDDIDADEAIGRGEKLLAECLSHAAAADMPVQPSVRIDLNASDGIARAANELRATLALIGWKDRQSVRARIFGTVMENLLDDCPPRLIFCRLIRPLNTTQRLLFPFLPLAENRRDLRGLLRDAKHLSKQIGADMLVYLTGSDTTALRRAIEAAPPSRPLTFVDVPTAAGMKSKLTSDIKTGDMIFLPSERRTGALWTPLCDSLPEMLAHQYPDNNLLVAYPALNPNADDILDRASANEATDERPFTLKSVDLETGVHIPGALRQMTAAAFPGDPDRNTEAYHLLLTSATSYPVELADGAVLLHGHCDHISEPVLIIGVGDGDWEFANIQKPPRVLLALLSPTSQPPSRHLKSLADLARRFLKPQFAAAVAAAPTAADIQTLLESPADD